MKPTERFTNRVEDYRRHRPSYPRDVVDFIREQGHLSKDALVADIGSGTGIFTRLLLEAGFKVTAIEPNAAMRSAALEDLADLAGFSSSNGTAEKTGLADHSMAAAVSAQAFHWFDRAAAQREFTRILQPGAWTFLVWNQWRGCPSAFNEDFALVIQKSQTDHDNAKAKTIEGERNLEDFFAPGSYGLKKFPNPHLLDWEALRGRFLSASYVPPESDPRSGSLLEELKLIFQKHARNQMVCLEQETRVHFGQMR